jgi:hypothetical protein
MISFQQGPLGQAFERDNEHGACQVSWPCDVDHVSSPPHLLWPFEREMCARHHGAPFLRRVIDIAGAIQPAESLIQAVEVNGDTRSFSGASAKA